MFGKKLANGSKLLWRVPLSDIARAEFDILTIYYRFKMQEINEDETAVSLQ